MQIEISGNKCVSCYKYTQYYKKGWQGEAVAVDCGYCGIKSRNVRPGDRCREYREMSNIGIPFGGKFTEVE